MSHAAPTRRRRRCRYLVIDPETHRRLQIVAAFHGCQGIDIFRSLCQPAIDRAYKALNLPQAAAPGGQKEG
jgi:hypothetical protein